MVTFGLVAILSELVDLTMKIADIIKNSDDISYNDKELFKDKIREMQGKVTHWE